MNRRSLLSLLPVPLLALATGMPKFRKRLEEAARQEEKLKGGWKRTVYCRICRYWDREHICVIGSERQCTSGFAECRKTLPYDSADFGRWRTTESRQWCGEFVRASAEQVRSEIAVAHRRMGNQKKKNA